MQILNRVTKLMHEEDFEVGDFRNIGTQEYIKSKRDLHAGETLRLNRHESLAIQLSRGVSQPPVDESTRGPNQQKYIRTSRMEKIRTHLAQFFSRKQSSSERTEKIDYLHGDRRSQVFDDYASLPEEVCKDDMYVNVDSVYDKLPTHASLREEIHTGTVHENDYIQRTCTYASLHVGDATFPERGEGSMPYLAPPIPVRPPHLGRATDDTLTTAPALPARPLSGDTPDPAPPLPERTSIQSNNTHQTLDEEMHRISIDRHVVPYPAIAQDDGYVGAVHEPGDGGPQTRAMQYSSHVQTERKAFSLLAPEEQAVLSTSPPANYTPDGSAVDSFF